jgi:ubiquinone/menaquinone biosynthesis C-methylase UbiE
MSPHRPLYDAIGRTYSVTRRPDPRFRAAVRGALGDARSVVNVGAGTGSYEPDDLPVVAVEPSEVMIHQRPPGSAPAVQSVAEHLPFRDGAFDAALVTFSVHHWDAPVAGLAELRRVSRTRAVILTTDPTYGRSSGSCRTSRRSETWIDAVSLRSGRWLPRWAGAAASGPFLFHMIVPTVSHLLTGVDRTRT